MIVTTARTKVTLVAVLLLLTVVPVVLVPDGDAVECEPICDSCHDVHDRIYHAYLDISRFLVPSALNGTDVGVVEVQLYLHGNVGLGYTSVRRGHLTLTANNDRVGVERPKQDFISYEPGFRSFYWNVTGRLNGTDTMHVEVYAMGVHLSVEFFLSGDSGPIVVTNPVNAPPRVSFRQPDGFNDVATSSYDIILNIDDPNNDPMLADFWYDDDRDRENGSTIIARSVAFPETYTWDTRGLPNGWYYLHVDVDDQMGGFDSATSEFPVIVSHSNRVPDTELILPVDEGTVRDPQVTLTWRSQDGDGDNLRYEVWVGRDREHMELIGTTTDTSYVFEPDDNARLYWTVIPDDGKVRGWCRNGPRTFRTSIEYPVEVDLVLPANAATVAGPDVKLVWYGRDLDFEQVFYTVWLEHDGKAEKLVSGWDDPAGPVLVVPDLVPGETYFWWVEGDNPYSPRGVSDTWRFTVASDGEPAVSLDDEEISQEGTTLYWSPSPEGTVPATYDVHLVDHVGGDTLVLSGTNATSLVLHDLVEDDTYHWYIIPYDEAGDQGHSVPSFRSFVQDLNSPPTVTIPNPYLEVDPGQHVLQWSGHDDDGDVITYDVYIDAYNGTTLVAANTTDTRHSVVLDADTMYFWRVVPRDALSIGTGSKGVVVTGPAGGTVQASGHLGYPADGASVAPPVVNLTWEANDTLGRTLLYNIYVNTTGGDPMSGPPMVVNATLPWFIIELAEGDQVSWAVEVRPLYGPASLLGTASFTVTVGASEAPVAMLAVAGEHPGSGAEVVALETVTLTALGSQGPLGEQLQYLFDFGDGSASGWVDTEEVEHTYLKEGTYNATLTVRVVDGPESEMVTMVMKVTPGDSSAEEGLPGMGGATAALALLLACLLAMTVSRRDRRGDGGR